MNNLRNKRNDRCDICHEENVILYKLISCNICISCREYKAKVNKIRGKIVKATIAMEELKREKILFNIKEK